MYVGQALHILVMPKCTRSYTEAVLIFLEALLNGIEKKLNQTSKQFTCIKSIIKKVEKGAKYMFKVNRKETRKSFWFLYC